MQRESPARHPSTHFCAVPTGLRLLNHAYPAPRCWAKIFRPASGTPASTPRASFLFRSMTRDHLMECRSVPNDSTSGAKSPARKRPFAARLEAVPLQNQIHEIAANNAARVPWPRRIDTLLCRPYGLRLLNHAYPAPRCWAKIFRPASGTPASTPRAPCLFRSMTRDHLIECRSVPNDSTSGAKSPARKRPFAARLEAVPLQNQIHEIAANNTARVPCPPPIDTLLCRPDGLRLLNHAYPAPRCWAKIFRPANGTPASAPGASFLLCSMTGDHLIECRSVPNNSTSGG